MGLAFWPDGCLAGITWLEGPEERSTKKRSADVDVAKGHPPSLCFFLHRVNTAIVRIGAAADDDGIARLAVKNGERLGTAGQQQEGNEQNK